MTNKPYTIEFDRKTCIGAAKCADVDIRRWELSSEDAKANLLGSTKHPTQERYTLDIMEDELPLVLEAAHSCPTNAIHIIKKATGERLI